MGVYGLMGDYLGKVASKRLSHVDIDPKRSNQHEFGDKGGVIRSLLGDRDRKASDGNGIPTTIMYLDDDEDPLVADIETTWYDARRNQPHRSPEWRLYYKDCPPIRRACPMDLMCVGMLTDGRLLILLTRHDSSMEAEIRWLLGIDDTNQSRFTLHDVTGKQIDALSARILEALGLEVKVGDDDLLQVMIDKWGYRFPSNADFALFAQQSLPDVDPAFDDPDDVVMAYYDRNYYLFRLFEHAIIQHEYAEEPFVDSMGVIDVDLFTTFYTRVRNRRMSRAGASLELHVSRIFDARGIRYVAQAHTEGSRRPDFLFPSQAAYDDPSYPSWCLRMLAAKTSLKDRFRQVADEANRIRDKHLLTITPGDVTHGKLDQMRELHLHLVMPHTVMCTYDDMVQAETMRFSDFLADVSSLSDRA